MVSGASRCFVVFGNDRYVNACFFSKSRIIFNAWLRFVLGRTEDASTWWSIYEGGGGADG